MLNLISASDKIQLVTGSSVTVDSHVSFIDYNAGTPSASRKNTNILTATTTDISGSPSAGILRNVKSIMLRNKHATASVDVIVQHTDGSITVELKKATLGPGAELHYTDQTGFFLFPQLPSASPEWYGNLYGAYGRCDPQQLLRMAQMAGTVAATPTNITASIARIAYFRPPADITVNAVRFYGVGSTTNIYTFAIYNGNTLERLTNSITFSTTANQWGSIVNGLNLTLSKNQLYFVAISVNTTGTTAGMLCMSPTVAATTGLIAVLPKNWPGNLSLNGSFMDGGFAQFAVSTGVMPNPAATIAAQAAWTGGFPLLFLDNNNA